MTCLPRAGADITSASASHLDSLLHASAEWGLSTSVTHRVATRYFLEATNISFGVRMDMLDPCAALDLAASVGAEITTVPVCREKHINQFQHINCHPDFNGAFTGRMVCF